MGSERDDRKRRRLLREIAAFGRELEASKGKPPKPDPPLGPRTVAIWTWDQGSRPVDMDWPTEDIVPILETILTGGLWKEFRKFPVDTVRRVLPRLKIPLHTRNLLEMWIEEAPSRESR